jgi:hypothetical protein
VRILAFDAGDDSCGFPLAPNEFQVHRKSACGIDDVFNFRFHGRFCFGCSLDARI